MAYTAKSNEKTDSNTPTGTFSHLVLFAITGKNAPEAEVTSITKIDAMRRLVYVSAPPPLPQSVEDMMDEIGMEQEGRVLPIDYKSSYTRCL